MTQLENSDNTIIFKRPVATMDEIQQGWHELSLRVGQLEAERAVLEHENKSLRMLLERVIEHRQRSHGELVLLLSGLVSKLPISDVGLVVSRLVEHNAHVAEVCATLAKGKMDASLPQPSVLKALDQTKRELAAAVQPAVEDLIKLETPMESALLRSFIEKSDNFFTPAAVRANRCLIKGQLPKERVVREFGEESLVFFNDLTTDPKLNPKPKPDEIVLAFKNDFEALFAQSPGLLAGKRDALMALYQRIQRSKAATDQARAQRNAFARLSFTLELLHYYENSSTEAPDVVFAQRLPAVIEQLVLATPAETLDEKLLTQAEGLLAQVISPDHRHMVINNVGKSGGLARTLRYVLTFRSAKIPEPEQALAEFVRHLLPAQKPPAAAALAPHLRLLPVEMQRLIARAIKSSDRLRKEEADQLFKELVAALALVGVEDELKPVAVLTPEQERQIAWDVIKDLINRRAEPAAIANAVRTRLRAKYDADEVKQSWITLTEADPITLIRTFCQLPYLPDGSTDSVARAVMETYVTRLTHEKYAVVYQKVLTSLRNMFKANATSPTLVNFMALVKWVDSDAAKKIGTDIGMPVAA
ncbi:MAG: hypothetical protein EPO07_20420 [Verrucomicrobia bacterium]|nr:MAG: hypothetical protein EPO07_20420 [Verrucomicrobiota bacterium]